MDISGHDRIPPVLLPGDMGPTAYQYFEDFLTSGKATATGPLCSSTADAAAFLTTLVGSSVPGVADAGPGGWLSCVNAGSDNDSIEGQLNGEAFQIKTDKDLMFRCRLKVDDADLSDWLIGLASTDTTMQGGTSPASGVNDFIGFGHKNALTTTDGDTADIYVHTSDDATVTKTDTGEDLSDDTFVELSFVIEKGVRVNFYVNGVFKASHTTNLPDDGTKLTPSFAIRNSSGAARTMSIDYIQVVQKR